MLKNHVMIASPSLSKYEPASPIYNNPSPEPFHGAVLPGAIDEGAPATVRLTKGDEFCLKRQRPSLRLGTTDGSLLTRGEHAREYHSNRRVLDRTSEEFDHGRAVSEMLRFTFDWLTKSIEPPSRAVEASVGIVSIRHRKCFQFEAMPLPLPYAR
jgi:hypothetical protein